jgi:peptidoglycan-associated lipoprotein
MMKRTVFSGVLIVFVLCLSLAFLSGCAKQAGVKSEEAISREAAPAAAQPQAAAPQAAAPSKAAAPTDDREARERALREQALRDQAAREAAEKAAREAAEKAAAEAAAREAAERAKKEAAERAKKEAAAILKALEIPDVHFDFDKYNLKSEEQALLKQSAPAWMKYKEYKLVVEGHCDERGSVEYNLALGQKRADEAAKYLVDLGIEKDRVKTISYGKEMPLDPGHDEGAWTKNRRAHFVIFPPVK